MDKDAGVVPVPKEPDPDNAQRDMMYGYNSTATFMDRRQSFAGKTFVFCLDSLSVTHNQTSANSKWVTPVAKGVEHIISRSDLYQHLVTAEALHDGARVQLEWTAAVGQIGQWSF